jgi:hypothetical protein
MISISVRHSDFQPMPLSIESKVCGSIADRILVAQFKGDSFKHVIHLVGATREECFTT